MTEINRRLLLKTRPEGRVKNSDFDLVEEAIPTIGEGEALVRTTYLSLDPTNRVWMTDQPGYLPPVQIGEVMRSGGLGRVVESNNPKYKVGQLVNGFTGWQDYTVASDSMPFTPLPEGLPVPDSAFLGALGMTGLTAYFGITDVAKVQAGETVVISAAAGAVGSVAGQVAKILGARVVGIAGGPEKCAEVVERYGFDVCLDYREPNLTRRLREVCPKGVDLYFDNVGGEILDAVLLNIAMRGRIVLCGAISQYNESEGFGLKNHTMMIMRRASMQGFIVLDYANRYGEAQLELGGMVLSGQLRHSEHIVTGLENAPVALNLLFSGGNHGKTLVVVDPTVTLS